MSIKNQATLTQVRAKDSPWDRAIAEAERQIVAAEEKIRGLRLSIQTFEEMRDKGEPWPEIVETGKEDQAIKAG